MPDSLAQIHQELISDLLQLSKKIIIGWNERRTLLLPFEILLVGFRPPVDFGQSRGKIIVLLQSSLTSVGTIQQRDKGIANYRLSQVVNRWL